jgi:general secretion pathway protein E
VLPVTSDIHRLIASKASDADIEAAARQVGMATMYESGATKAWHGGTTVEEVLRATRVA